MILFARRRMLAGPLTAAWLAASCSPTPGAGAEWAVRTQPGACSASRRAGGELLAFLVAADSRLSGIAISSAAMDRFKPGRAYQRARLLVNGERLAAEPTGSRTADGVPALFFRLDPAPLMRTHPGGFTLAMTYGGRTLYSASLDDVASNFRRLQACARKLGR